MKCSSISLETMSIDQLADYITNKMNINLQLEIVGCEYDYSFTNFNDTERRDVILSSLKQMPEDIIENIIKNGRLR